MEVKNEQVIQKENKSFLKLLKGNNKLLAVYTFDVAMIIFVIIISLLIIKNNNKGDETEVVPIDFDNIPTKESSDIPVSSPIVQEQPASYTTNSSIEYYEPTLDCKKFGLQDDIRNCYGVIFWSDPNRPKQLTQKILSASDYEKKTFIHDYYGNLAQKKFETAYSVGAQGRNYDEFVNLYKDISFLEVLDEPIYLIADNTFELYVYMQNPDSYMVLYKVTIEVLKDNSGQLFINSSDAQMIASNNLEFTCYEDDYGENCYLHTTDRILFPIRTYRGQYFLRKQKVENNKVYFSDFGGAAYQGNFWIYEYDINMKTLAYIDVFKLGYENYMAKEDEDSTQCRTSNSDLANFEMLQKCYNKYEQEWWYQELVKSYTELPKYLGENDGRFLWGISNERWQKLYQQ